MVAQSQLEDRERLAKFCDFLSKRKEFFCSYFKKQLATSKHTQTSLALLISADNSAISHWLCGRRMPPPSMIPDICHALNLDERRCAIFSHAFLAAKHAQDLIEMINSDISKDRDLSRTVQVMGKLITKHFNFSLE